MKNSLRRLILTALLVSAVPGPAPAQPRPVRFVQLGVGQGLSNSTVRAIAQDRDGFLWFATEDGLNRYDGYGFTAFRHRAGDSTSVPGNFMSILATDTSGALWVCADNVIGRYDKVRDLFVPAREIMNVLVARGVTAIWQILFDRAGKLWIATPDRGVIAADPRTLALTSYPLGDSLHGAGASVTALALDSAGRVWVGTERSGLAVISADGKSVKVHTGIPGDAAGLRSIRALTCDARGRTWVATALGTIYCADAARDTFAAVYPFPAGPPVWVFSLLADATGRLWIGTFNGGLFVYDPRERAAVRYQYNPYDPSSLPGDRIYTMFQDRSGSIWVGTWKGGIGAHHPSAAKFEHITHAWYDTASLSALAVLSVCEDRRGTLWVGTEGGGLNARRRGEERFRHYRRHPGEPGSISGNTVLSISEDSSGQIWCGMLEDGLSRYDRARDRFVTYRHNPSDAGTIGSDRVTALCTDRDGVLWVGGAALDRYDAAGDRFVHYDSARVGTTLVRDADVQSIAEDRSGNLWIGLFPRGLVRLEKATLRVRRYAEPVGVYHLHVDDAGVVWVGSFGKGLYRYVAAADTFMNYSDADGLPSNFVKSILSVAPGSLWLGTSRGLSHFDPGRRSARNYDPADGVQGFEFRSTSCFRGRDGKLYFGGTNGLNVFHPDSVRDNTVTPPVVITSCKVLDMPVPLPQGPDGEIRLRPGADFVAFEFVALDYAAPARSRYAYRLEGLEPDWVSCGSRRYASYAHLEPGDYVFRVRGSNGDGVWNTAGAAVRITVLPPFWETWWFRISVTLALAAVAYALYRYRLARVLEIERTRAAIATDLHDDIGATLTNVALLSDLARREVASSSPGVDQRLEKISSVSRSLLDAMNDIVWSIKPENDALEQALLRMEDHAVELLAEHGVDLHVEVPDALKTLHLPMTVRRNLFLIFKEAVANVLKHAQATRVDVQLVRAQTGRRGHQLLLRIRDNGRGFDTASPREGNGLANMAVRARNLRGTVSVHSEPGRGTLVELAIPLRSPG